MAQMQEKWDWKKKLFPLVASVIICLLIFDVQDCNQFSGTDSDSLKFIENLRRYIMYTNDIFRRKWRIN